MSLFPEWQEAHKNDEKLLPRRINEMHALHGKLPGKKCKGCKHLERWSYSRDYIKCSKSKMTHGAGTDWRTGWPACGLYEESEAQS